MNKLISIFSPQSPIILGRWKLKHNDIYCDWWAHSLNPDPGYPNSYIKISISNKIQNKKNIINSRGHLWLQLFHKVLNK